MNQQELTSLLARISVHTGQRPDPVMLAAWADELDPDMTLRDAISAVTEHYREKTWHVLPADINLTVRRWKKKRLENANVTVGDPPSDPAVYPAWQKARIVALQNGHPPITAEKAAWEAIGQAPPVRQVESGQRFDLATALARLTKTKNTRNN